MATEPEVKVTLSAPLLRRILKEAVQLGVSVEWMIASLIVDTVETIEQTRLDPVAA